MSHDHIIYTSDDCGDISFFEYHYLSEPMIKVIDSIWQKAVKEASKARCDAAVDWIVSENLNPLKQVPVLFIQLPAGDAYTITEIFDLMDESMKALSDKNLILRLRAPQDASLSFVDLINALWKSQKSSAQKNLTETITPQNFLEYIKRLASQCIIVIDCADHMDTHVLHALIWFSYQSRKLPCFPGNQNRISFAILLGVVMSSVEYQMSKWNSQMKRLCVTSSATVSSFNEILINFQFLMSVDERLLTTIEIPDDYLQVILNEAKQYNYSLSAVNRRLKLYIISAYDSLEFPFLYLPIIFEYNLTEKIPNDGFLKITVNSKITDQTDTYIPDLCSVLKSIYDFLLSSAECDEYTAEELSTQRVLSYWSKYFSAVSIIISSLLKNDQKAQIISDFHKNIDGSSNNLDTTSLDDVLHKFRPDIVIPNLLHSLIFKNLTKDCMTNPITLNAISSQLNEVYCNSQDQCAESLKIRINSFTKFATMLSSFSLQIDHALHSKRHETQSLIKGLKLMTCVLTNPTPTDALIYTARHASKFGSRTYIFDTIKNQHLLNFINFLDITHPKIHLPLQDALCAFINSESVRINTEESLCFCVQCISDRFLYVLHASILLGLVSSPRICEFRTEDKTHNNFRSSVIHNDRWQQFPLMIKLRNAYSRTLF